MIMWEKVIIEYFARFDTGTTRQILNWILSKYNSEIEDNFGQEYDKATKNDIFLPRIWGTKSEYVDYKVRNLGKTENPIDGTIRRLYQKGKLKRRETRLNSCKWEYYYPENIHQANQK